jgi:hypothetical protein
MAGKVEQQFSLTMKEEEFVTSMNMRPCMLFRQTFQKQQVQQFETMGAFGVAE